MGCDYYLYEYACIVRKHDAAPLQLRLAKHRMYLNGDEGYDSDVDELQPWLEAYFSTMISRHIEVFGEGAWKVKPHAVEKYALLLGKHGVALEDVQRITKKKQLVARGE